MAPRHERILNPLVAAQRAGAFEVGEVLEIPYLTNQLIDGRVLLVQAATATGS